MWAWTDGLERGTGLFTCTLLRQHPALLSEAAATASAQLPPGSVYDMFYCTVAHHWPWAALIFHVSSCVNNTVTCETKQSEKCRNGNNGRLAQ